MNYKNKFLTTVLIEEDFFLGGGGDGGDTFWVKLVLKFTLRSSPEQTRSKFEKNEHALCRNPG